MLKRSAGFDVPDMLAAGPRDVLVPRSGAEVAREVLMQAELLGATNAAHATATRRRGSSSASWARSCWWRLIAWIGTELLL